jgi:hypothetical protein
MPYVPRNEQTLAMFKAQPGILRDPNTERDDRIFAFYAVLTMKWATEGKITMDEIGMTTEEANELSIRYNPEFMEAMKRLALDMVKGEEEKQTA